LRVKLGQTEAALAGFREALALLQKLVDELPDDPIRRANLASAHNSLGFVLTDLNQGEKAAEHYRNALASYRKLADDFPNRVRSR
jgi:tetratricopeptide (TPR) repeat protein